MTTRPIVNARFIQDYRREDFKTRLSEKPVRVITTPGVTVSVEFDLHDHEEALRHLDIAVANVRAQIEETR